MIKSGLLTSLLLASIFLFSQSNSEDEKIIIKGITTNILNSYSTQRLDKVKINIYEYNIKLYSYCTDNKGKFEISIPSNSYIVLEFEKDQFVSKRFLFDTRDYSIKSKEKLFDIEITMLKHVEGIDYSELDFPITRIEYNQETQELNYNIEYTRLMLAKQETIMLEQEKMMLEIARNESNPILLD